jgi:hypothetical protein
MQANAVTAARRIRLADSSPQITGFSSPKVLESYHYG